MSTDKEFQFKRYCFVPQTCTLHLHYAFDGGPDFEEKIVFPPTDIVLTGDENEALDRIFKLIFLLAGVSYYKAHVPNVLRCEAYPLDHATAAFLTRTYTKGLAEFAHKNALNIRDRVNFVAPSCSPPAALRLGPGGGVLIPVGGGKDSIVTVECMKSSQRPIVLFAMGSQAGVAQPILRTAERAQLPLATVARAISPNLVALNAAGALNGHVPITAILSAIAVACAIRLRARTVIMSNESSANAPNLTIGGFEVNHQYSKSLDFETDFSSLVATIVSPDIRYFSFLRPLSEVEITRRFARLERYHQVFRSCNTAYRQSASDRGTAWCCNCPKCRFVFLALAPFLAKSKLVAIFGKNLLSDASQRAGFEELCGFGAHKPFECVGEIEESQLLMGHLYRSSAWADDLIVQSLGPVIADKEPDLEERYQRLFADRAAHRIPNEFLGVLDACQ